MTMRGHDYGVISTCLRTWEGSGSSMYRDSDAILVTRPEYSELVAAVILGPVVIGMGTVAWRNHTK